jgi:pimeloyl-ACP methyl ester carboxylesterase
MVLVPGLTEQGPDDPRLVSLAQSLARMRFAVLVPDLANLRRLQIDPRDGRAIADAAVAVSGLPAAGAAASPVGLAAVSYAVGPALIAALEPDVAGRIGFLVAIGGYYDMGAAVTYITTGRFRTAAGEPWLAGRPHGLAKWRFVAVNANRLDDPSDRAAFAVIAARRAADPAADIGSLAAGLGAEGRALLALLENTDPDAVSGLIEALPPSIRSGFEALSPSRRDLTALQARLILIHGRDDPAVPYTESMALAAAAPSGQADLYLVDGLDHVDFRAELGLSDQLILLEAGQAVLAERDRIAAGSTDGAIR